MKLALLLAAVAVWATSGANAQAQVGYVTYYRPLVRPLVVRPVVRPLVVVQQTPVYHTSYFAAAPVVASAPMPAPMVVAPAPIVVAPAPVVYPPAVRVRSRYRPFLGGSVTRVRYGYAPAYYAPAYYAPTSYSPAYYAPAPAAVYGY